MMNEIASPDINQKHAIYTKTEKQVDVMLIRNNSLVTSAIAVINSITRNTLPIDLNVIGCDDPILYVSERTIAVMWK